MSEVMNEVLMRARDHRIEDPNLLEQIRVLTVPPAAGGQPDSLGIMRSMPEPIHEPRFAYRCPGAQVDAWVDGVANWEGARCAAVGGLQACDAASATAVLCRAVAELRALGVEAIVGPMQGSTWRSYRLVTERGSRPRFFMEPIAPAFHRDAFEAVGFDPIAHYRSSETDDLRRTDPRLERVEERFAASGLTVRPIDPDRFDDELIALHQLSMVAFANNFLFRPIDVDPFIAMYRPIQAHLVPELVLMAESAGELVGFVFGVPDLEQAKRGERVDTVVVKTVACRPGRTYAGLGALLLQRCHDAARRLGFRRAIHALMHEHNVSLRLSGHYARPFRRYALYGRRLTP